MEAKLHSMEIKLILNLVVMACVISALRRLRQEHPEFEASLGYIARPVSKEQIKTKKKLVLISVTVLC
jgi:hypothetical protein